MKHLVALLMIAFFVAPTVAMAKNPCKEDKAKFCKDVKASGGKVGTCLRQHMNDVSDECKARLNRSKGAADAEKAAKKAKPEGAAPDADSSAEPSKSE